MFDKTEEEPFGACLIIPAPNLLAEPSRPSANTGSSVNVPLSVRRIFVFKIDKTWILQRTSCSISRHHLVLSGETEEVIKSALQCCGKKKKTDQTQLMLSTLVLSTS